MFKKYIILVAFFIVFAAVFAVPHLAKQVNALSTKPTPVPIPVPNPGNQWPTATIEGPSAVFANTTASWSFRGFDLEDSLLSYTIYWGDGITETGSISSGMTFVRSHAYSSPSIMRTLQLTITDSLSTSAVTVFAVTVLP